MQHEKIRQDVMRVYRDTTEHRCIQEADISHEAFVLHALVNVMGRLNALDELINALQEGHNRVSAAVEKAHGPTGGAK